MLQKINGYSIYAVWLVILLLNGCAAGPTSTVSPAGPFDRPTSGISSGSVVAVWNLEDMSVAGNATLQQMNEFLSAKVSETLKDKGGFEVIEREKLLLALEELNLGSSALADESSRLEVGKVLGARLMVFGGYQQVGDQFRVDLRMVDVESGAVVRTGDTTRQATESAAWIQAVEDAAAGLL